MPTDHELAVTKARQAWMLRVARLTDPREPTLAEIAVAAGLGEGSGSVVSLWERNRTKGDGPKQSQLRRLAAFYGLPLNVFTEPEPTDEERLAGLRRLAIAAVELEQADWDREGEQPQDGEDGPGGPPHRPQA